MSVTREQRWNRDRRCPICGGCEQDPRGVERRCIGFLSSDGKYAHCSREEHAAGLDATEAGTYAHRLQGPCRCGAQHGVPEPAVRDIEATYDYRDENGALLFQVVRRAGKQFRQRKPEGDGWSWQLNGTRRVLYRLPELGRAAGSRVFIVEGEKDVEALRSRGLVATCNPMGAGKWRQVAEHAAEVLRDREVVVISDADDVGRKHAREVLGGLASVARSILLLELPAKDASDWFAAGGTVEQLDEIIEAERFALRDREPPPELLYEDRDALDEARAGGTLPADVDAPPPFRLITVDQALEDLQYLAKAGIYPTPFPALNAAIGFGGFLGSQVYNLAAGTGRGKTTWVAAVGAHTAELETPVLVATYEMQPGYFVARKVAGTLGVHSNAIIRAEVNAGAISAALSAKLRRFLVLMDRPTLGQLEAAIAHITKVHGKPPLVIVDYLQKLAEAIFETMARPDLRIATTQASARLLEIGFRTRAAIVAVSAIGRGKKNLSNPRKLDPYDLVEVAKESGAVEYDGAGMIVLSLSKDLDGEEHIATMTVAKARFGSTCHIDARYHGALGRWTELGRIEPPPPSSSREEQSTSATEEFELEQQVLASIGAEPAAGKTELRDRLARTHHKRPLTWSNAIDRLLERGSISSGGKTGPEAVKRRGGPLELVRHGHQERLDIPEGAPNE